MIRETYYTNTTGGHNKDYLMVMDDETLTLTCTWGPIGGTKQVDKYESTNAQELYSLETDKHNRRLRHGYTIVTKNSFESSNSEFVNDLRDLIAAERLSA